MKEFDQQWERFCYARAVLMRATVEYEDVREFAGVRSQAYDVALSAHRSLRVQYEDLRPVTSAESLDRVRARRLLTEYAQRLV